MIKVKCKECGGIATAEVHGIYPRHIYVFSKHHHKGLSEYDYDHKEGDNECSLVGWGAQWKDILSPRDQVEAESLFHALTQKEHEFWYD